MVLKEELAFSWTGALVALGLLFIFTVPKSNRGAKVPDELPWVGGKYRGMFRNLRAAIHCVRYPIESLREGYDKYLQEGKSYLFPTLNGNSEIIIPNDELRWLLDQPDSKSSGHHAHYDMLAGRYAYTHPDLLQYPLQVQAIYRNVPRKVPQLIPESWDEIRYQVDTAFGLRTDAWSEVHVFDKMNSVLAGTSNRMLVGLPLCRNSEFHKLVMRYASNAVLVMTVLQLIPQWLQQIVGNLLSVLNHVCVWQAKRIVLPIIQKRITDLDSDEGSKSAPEDYLTWQIQLGKSHPQDRERDPDWICRRLMVIEFAAIHTSTFTIVNILFDLLGSDPQDGYIEGIREEVETIYKEYNGTWCKEALAKMLRTDSAIRESMRISGISVKGIHRKVMDKSGLRSKEGWIAPYGSIIATDVWSQHHNPSIYREPSKYDAFRFSRIREQYTPSEAKEKYLEMQRYSLLSTGFENLAFGHGRHACPGRFFINLELKLLLAYIVMNYELKYLPERPKNAFIGEVVIPPTKASIQVKRRVTNN